jgi:CBS domain containing-hemolysin-like protein
MMYIFGETNLLFPILHDCSYPEFNPAPIAWPIAQLLDYVLGESEGHSYKKAELKSFLQFHRESAEPLRDDEITILNGVLSLSEKKLEEIMTPMKVLFRGFLFTEGAISY